MDKKLYEKRLKSSGARMTVLRKELLELFENSQKPLSALEIKDRFLKANKTTIYRELEFLLKHEVIEEVNFGDGKKRYELSRDHHHHIICVDCKRVEDIKVDPVPVNFKDFKILSHSLEFFGLCGRCK